ncbi:hypothetical protein NE237_033167 [Protea cynaroides]|uniref:Glycosyltransferase n=1 Tax=Protea cynaroides TaxID=273540 RepID=A0A9Q0R3S9_9MAGN|nr:hypothetical protein NE237_033167 [Protea cynaroides]
MAKKASLVFIPAPAVGHIVSAIELAKVLIARDHRLSLTVLIIKIPNSPSFDALIEALITSVTAIRFIYLPQLQFPTPDRAQSTEGLISVFIDDHKPFIKDTITQLFLATESESEPTRSRLAGLVVDFFCTSMIDVANELGVPSYLFFTSSVCFLSFMLHLPNLDTQTHNDFKDLETELVIPGFINPVPPHVLPLAVSSKKQDGYTWYLYHSRRFSETKGIIVNTFAELEPYAASFLSGNDGIPPVYPVGPLLDLQGQMHSVMDQTKFESIKRWLDNQPPSSVVWLCFGSFGSFGVPQVQEIARGLERSGHRFLWSLRQPSVGLSNPTDYVNHEEVLPEGFLDRTAERGLVCGWVPQVEVLAHPAIGGFVSHCGWNSTLESIWFGVPVAAWPLYAEQHLNAFEMVKELEGLVVELRLDYRGGDDLVTAEEVERAVRSLMDSDCKMRMRIKEMQEKSRKTLIDGGSSFNSLVCLIKDILDES